MDRDGKTVTEDCKDVAAQIPIYKQELGCQVEVFASRLEIHASFPPQILWKTVDVTPQVFSSLIALHLHKHKQASFISCISL
jgi:hypothetical protein